MFDRVQDRPLFINKWQNKDENLTNRKTLIAEEFGYFSCRNIVYILPVNYFQFQVQIWYNAETWVIALNRWK